MSAETDGRAAAERFRSDQHLGVQPLGDLVAVIEHATEVDVAVLDVGPDEHGLTMRDPDREVTMIAVARTERPMRQRSSLAHELAHVLFEDWRTSTGDEWNARSREEVRADAFARHLLMPVAGLREFLEDTPRVDQAVVSALTQRFLVSPALAAIALQQAAYITEATKQELMSLTTPKLALRYGWLDQYRALQADANRRRPPQRLLARLIVGYQAGVVSAQTIATLRGLDRATVEAELSDADIHPPDTEPAWAAPDDLPEIEVDLSDLDDGPPGVRDGAG